jgi:D-aminoacyl-tRNA deacylase
VRVVLQRVSDIGAGLLLLVGIAAGDGEAEADWLAQKISGLRIFNDGAGKMNLSVRDAGGEVLAVSQFTLLADTRKGKRPSFVGAAPPEEAERLFDYFCERLRAPGTGPVKTGVFGAVMEVALVNDGPVTIILER